MALVESKLSNAYETTLASALLADSADTTISVAGAPTDSGNTAISPSAALPMYLIIDPDSDSLREYVRVTAISGTTLTATRNIDTGGGALKAHAIGAKVRQAAVAQMFDDLHDRIDTLNYQNLFKENLKQLDPEELRKLIENLDFLKSLLLN